MRRPRGRRPNCRVGKTGAEPALRIWTDDNQLSEVWIRRRRGRPPVVRLADAEGEGFAFGTFFAGGGPWT